MSGSLLKILSRLQASSELRFNAVKFATARKLPAREFSIAAVAGNRLNLDSNNVVCSPFSELPRYEGILLHELITENINRWHDKTALVCSATGRSYTYEQLRKLSSKLATSLRKCKLQPGDTIATVLPNIPEFAILILAASEAGLRTTLINPGYTSYEIKNQLTNSEASAVITVPRKYADVTKSVENNKNIKVPIIVVNDGTGPAPEGSIKFEDLIRDDIEEFSETNCAHHEDTVFLPFSSGTTGLPKGVDLSHRNVVANVHQLGAKEIFSGIETTATHQDVVPVVLPLFHIYGLVVVLCQYLRYGTKMVCMPQFSMTDFLRLMETFKPTMLYVAPPLVQMMAHNEDITPRHAEAIRFVMSGAAPLGEETIALFRKRVNPNALVVQGYGLTETSPVVTTSKGAPPAASGYVVPDTQVRIVGSGQENLGKNLGPNEVGELYVRGPQVMKGYYKNPEATAQTMDGEWFKTGDLATYDERGLVYIRGRLKELIKVKGFQVPPAELEELIRGMDKVQDVAVIGVNHERYGEIPKAFIVPKKGVKIEEEEVKDFVAERVAKHKQLGHVQFIDSIPKSAAGKILRRQLQDM